MKKIILLAAVLYFLVAPFTYHPDTKLVLYYPTLNNSKVWNIYTYLNTHQDDAPKFHYPPMHYWVLKAELPLVKLIGGKNIVNWLKTGGNVAFNDPKVYLYNLACKFPLLILILLSGVLIGKIAIKNGYKKEIALKAIKIWLFNPLTLYSAVIMGQNDILAICPFLIGLYFYSDLPFLAFFLFGVSGSIKNYPLIWAIILALIYPKVSWFKKIVLGTVAVGLYLLSMAPFLGLNYFREDVLYSGLSIRMFESVLNIGFGEKILLVPVLLLVVILIAVKKNLGRSLRGQMSVLLTATILILGLTHFHPQWLIWIMPFVAIILAIEKENWWFWLLMPAVALITLLFEDKFLYWGLLTPINSNLINLPFMGQYLQTKGVDIELLNNLCHSVVAGVAIYWLWNLGNLKHENRK